MQFLPLSLKISTNLCVLLGGKVEKCEDPPLETENLSLSSRPGKNYEMRFLIFSYSCPDFFAKWCHTMKNFPAFTNLFHNHFIATCYYSCYISFGVLLKGCSTYSFWIDGISLAHQTTGCLIGYYSCSSQ